MAKLKLAPKDIFNYIYHGNTSISESHSKIQCIIYFIFKEGLKKRYFSSVEKEIFEARKSGPVDRKINALYNSNSKGNPTQLNHQDEIILIEIGENQKIVDLIERIHKKVRILSVEEIMELSRDFAWKEAIAKLSKNKKKTKQLILATDIAKIKNHDHQWTEFMKSIKK